MSRMTRVRWVSKAVSSEVARIWQRWASGRGTGRSSSLTAVRCDPLEERIMFAAPVISTIPAVTTDEGKLIVACATFSDSDGPCGCSGYTASIDWGDGCSNTCISLCASCSCGCACGSVCVSHVYTDNLSSNQAYSATLSINDGSQTGSRSFSVTVRDVAPTLTMGGAATVNEGSGYTLSLARSDHGNDTLGNWTISWGDTSTTNPAGTTTSTTHTFGSGHGHASISASASDEDGGPYSAHKVTQDTGFGSGGLVSSPSLGRVQAMTVQPDGKILAAFGNGGSGIDKDFIIARFNSNGSIDTSFGTTSGSSPLGYRVVDFGSSSSDYVSSVAYVNVGGNGKIYVAGSRSSGTTSNDFAIMRFDAVNGDLDSGFGDGGKFAINFNNGYDYAYGMALQGDKIILVGSSESSAGSNNFDFALGPDQFKRCARYVLRYPGDGQGDARLHQHVQRGLRRGD